MGTNAAASSRTSHPRSCARATHSSGCCTPEKFDWAGNANSLGLGPAPASSRSSTAPSSALMSGGATGTYTVCAPRARANSRMPFTELWLSKVRRNVPPASNGYDSPTSFSAWLALFTKTHTYSSGAALKYRSTAARHRSTSSDDRTDVGFEECGLP